MPTDHLTSPDDPEWVDAIVRRALERAAHDPDPVNPPLAATTSPLATSIPPQAQTFEAPLGTDTLPVPRPEIPETSEEFYRNGLDATDGALEFAAAEFPAAERPAVEYGDDEHDRSFDEALDLDDGDDHHLGAASRMRSFLEWGAVIVSALAVALLIKTFLMQAYVIPSSSMEHTLEIEDRVLVNKLSYAVGEISRGDLIVFHRPPSQATGEDDLIKRVIGLGGETIEIRDGEVFIREPGATETFRINEPYLEDGVTTEGLHNPPGCVEGTTDEITCTIPEGHLFMMGDNRGGSQDSRWFGPIDEDLVVGRAFLRVWPLNRLGFL